MFLNLIWVYIVEETYGLVQQEVSEGLSTLKEECRDFAKTLEGTIRSDMDQILNCKNFLAGKIKGLWRNSCVLEQFF